MKFKMQVKVNFVVAERCHYHHATCAHQQQSQPCVSLQRTWQSGGSSQTSNVKEELLRGNDQRENL